MEVGIGLPNAVPGTSGRQLTDWAGAAEEADFSALGTIDRTVYPAFEQAGCDELVIFPCASDPEQVRLLAEAAGM